MIKLTSGDGNFQIIPEGETILKILAVEYKQAVGQMKVTMANPQGLKHTETFRFITKQGKRNEGGINVFSYFAHTALNDFSLDEIDEQELVGKSIQCTVEHDVQPNINDPSKTVTFVRLSGFKVAPVSKVDPLDEI